VMRGGDVEEETGIQSCTLMNDLECAAHGISVLEQHDLVLIKAGRSNDSISSKVSLVVSLGTGLGVSFIAEAANGSPIIRASEAGWMQFAPETPLDHVVVRFIQRRLHVSEISYEHLCAGPALLNHYAMISGCETPTMSAEDICKCYSSDTVSKAAVDRLMFFLGRFLAQLSIIFQPNCGIFLTGGLLEGLSAFLPLTDNSFIQGLRTLENEVLHKIADSFAVYRVKRSDLGLLGARQVCLLRSEGSPIEI